MLLTINLTALALLLVALLLLARLGGIYPHRPLALLLVVPTFMSFWLIFLPQLWPLVAVVDGMLVLVALFDLLTLRRGDRFDVDRQVGRTASLQKPHHATLTLTNRTGRDQPVVVRDGVPSEFCCEPPQFEVSLPATSRASLHYTLTPERRGAFAIETVFLRLRSRFALWHRQVELPCHSHIDVYPDMKQLGDYALLARTNRLSLIGMRRTRRLGQDNEFERLRDYTHDDSYRHIDWRSTARRNKLTVRDFQANQSQRIVFLVDCGRMMTGEAAGISLLDHSLNAMLMMAYVALNRSDQVGLVCFDNEIRSYVPPRGGMGQMNRLLHGVYDRFPAMVESRYDEAFLHLSTHVRKRALVVLITNVVDEVNAQAIERHLKAIGGRHLSMAVLLRDHALFDSIEEVEELLEAAEEDKRGQVSFPAEQPHLTAENEKRDLTPFVQIADEPLFEAAAAAEILAWRRQVLLDLEHQGVLLVDSFPEDLTGPLVNRYLEVKARHLL